jgi:hypothetical protein
LTFQPFNRKLLHSNEQEFYDMSSNETVLGAKVSPVILQACKITAASLGYKNTSDWLRDLVERAIDPDAMARAQALFVPRDAHFDGQMLDKMSEMPPEPALADATAIEEPTA